MSAKLKWAVPVALTCGLVAFLLLRTPDGAQYAGRDLNYWVAEAPRSEAQGPILNILTNHCEAVLRRMRSEPRYFERKRLQLYRALPVRLTGLRPVAWLFGASAQKKDQYCAGVAFILSTPAADIVADQLRRFSSPTNPLCAEAILAMTKIGPEAFEALEQTATNRAHPWRRAAIWGLASARMDPEHAQRVLTPLLSDPDARVRREAWYALFTATNRINR